MIFNKPKTKSTLSIAEKRSATGEDLDDCRRDLFASPFEKQLRDETLLGTSTVSHPSTTSTSTATPSTTTATHSCATEIIKNDALSPSGNKKQHAIADLLRQQQEVSNFFQEAAVRLTNLVEHSEQSHKSTSCKGRSSKKNKEPSRTIKADQVRCLVGIMAVKHQQLADKVATIAREALQQVDEKQQQKEVLQERVRRMQTYIETKRRARRRFNDITAANLSSSLPNLHHHQPESETSTEETEDTHLDGVPTEIECQQTSIDLFQILSTGDDSEKSEEMALKRAEKLLAPSRSNSVRFFL